MKVGIDARALSVRGGGDGTYVRNVIRTLASVDPGGEYTLFLSPPLPDDRIPHTERMRRVMVPPASRLLRVPITLPAALLRERIDVVHVQYVAPPICPARIVYALHDIAFEHYPQFYTASDLLQLRMVVPFTLRRAKTVLTLSEFSKCDIVRRYCVPPEKIVVTPCAADPIFRPLHNEELLSSIRSRYAMAKQFILAVGHLQPRKNLKTLIEAYVRLRKSGATHHKLVLVGPKAWLYDETFSAARASGYSDDLIFTGFVPSDDLVALYNAADLFVYPSLYEGFGLPPLEAMACGTPVITSNSSSLPEVVGDAACTVDPLDADELATAIARVLSNPDLRTRLSIRGLRRSQTFSWDTTGRILIDVYRRAIQSS